MAFQTDINIEGAPAPEVSEEEKLVSQYLPEVVSKLKRIDPARYGAVDPGKLTPDNPLYGEVRRQVLKIAKPQQLEGQIQDALGSLKSTPGFEDYYKQRLSKVKAATETGAVADLRTRESDLRKRLISAMSEARQKYQGVIDPFEREKLAAGDTAQLEDEANRIRELRAPEMALYGALPALAQRDQTNAQSAGKDKVTSLLALYNKAQADAGGLDSSYNKLLALEQAAALRKKTGGGGGGGGGLGDLAALLGGDTGDDSFDASGLLDSIGGDAPADDGSSDILDSLMSAAPTEPSTIAGGDGLDGLFGQLSGQRDNADQITRSYNDALKGIFG